MYYLTFTLHFFVIFPDLIVIVAVPFFLPVIFPYLLTIAIFLFEDLYVTVSGLPAYESLGFNVVLLPFFTFIEDLMFLIAVVPGTVIVHTALLEPDFTVIFAVPAEIPLTLPFLLTVTIFLLEVEYLTFFHEEAGFRVDVLPFFNVSEDGIRDVDLYLKLTQF